MFKFGQSTIDDEVGSVECGDKRSMQIGSNPWGSIRSCRDRCVYRHE